MCPTSPSPSPAPCGTPALSPAGHTSCPMTSEVSGVPSRPVRPSGLTQGLPGLSHAVRGGLGDSGTCTSAPCWPLTAVSVQLHHSRFQDGCSGCDSLWGCSTRTPSSSQMAGAPGVSLLRASGFGMVPRVPEQPRPPKTQEVGKGSPRGPDGGPGLGRAGRGTVQVTPEGTLSRGLLGPVSVKLCVVQAQARYPAGDPWGTGFA
jgi:hypothetical protein